MSNKNALPVSINPPTNPVLHKDKQAPAPKSPEKSVIGSKSNKAEGNTKEIGGPKGLEPTRYGDWESKGRCYDF